MRDFTEQHMFSRVDMDGYDQMDGNRVFFCDPVTHDWCEQEFDTPEAAAIFYEIACRCTKRMVQLFIEGLCLGERPTVQ